MYFNYPRGQAYIRAIDRKLTNIAPEVVICHLVASPEVIRRRMKKTPHPYQILHERDVEKIQERVEEEMGYSLISHKMTLDTSTSTIDETMSEFVAKIEPYLTYEDRMRISKTEVL